MKGMKIRHLLGVPKAANAKRTKTKITYLFDRTQVPSPKGSSLRERRLNKQTYN